MHFDLVIWRGIFLKCFFLCVYRDATRGYFTLEDSPSSRRWGIFVMLKIETILDDLNSWNELHKWNEHIKHTYDCKPGQHRTDVWFLNVKPNKFSRCLSVILTIRLILLHCYFLYIFFEYDIFLRNLRVSGNWFWTEVSILDYQSIECSV